ncbi:MAG: 50S ribosome-binding GTPase [Planctomycetota bacterium]|nr:50S ribosome-binding GTPase [Planctomycetota bacterium]
MESDPFVWSCDSGLGTGAIALITIVATPSTLDRVCTALSNRPSPRIGSIAHRSFLDIDDGLFMRASSNMMLMAPHGGIAVRHKFVAALTALGGTQSEMAASEVELRSRWPEANEMVEACMLETLSHCQGRIAVEQLLKQPALWRSAKASDGLDHHDQSLRWLVSMPTVVITGPANAGKSTLINALAGRAVSLVSNIPGTTRDHVGTIVDLAGIHAAVVDLPGERGDADAIETQASRIAEEVIERAALIVAVHAPGQQPCRHRACAQSTAQTLSVQLQADRPSVDSKEFASDYCISALTGAGMIDFVTAVKDALVPPAALHATTPWRFHPLLKSWRDRQSPTIE